MDANNNAWSETIRTFITGQLFRFALVGTGCASVEFFTFHVLYQLYTINYLVSNVISVSIAIILNYFLSRKYVFQKSKHPITVEVTSFIVFSMAAILLNHVILWFLVEIVEAQHIGLCKAATIVVVAVFNFVTKKHIVFKTG